MSVQEEKYKNIFYPLQWKAVSAINTGIMLCAFMVIAYCIWTLDRGFEITDEAYYLLLAMHADSVEFYISAQQWITSGIWQITGSLVWFRAAGMALLLASSTLLALGVFSMCQRLDLVADRIESKSLVIAGSVVGAMLYASTINLSPCYNLLASVGAYAAAGMVLLALNRLNLTSKYVLYAFAGCAAGVAVVAKPSAGVAMLALLVLWVVLFEFLRRDKVFGTAAIVFGAIIFTGVLLLVNTTVSEALQAIGRGMQLFRMVQVETVGARLLRYFIEYWTYILITLRSFAIPILAMMVYVITRRTFFAKLSLVAIVVTLILGRHMYSGWNTDGSFPAPVAIYAMLGIVLILSISIWNKNRSTLIFFSGLLVLPYTVAIGTGNVLFSQAVDSLAPWAAMVVALMVSNRHNDFKKIITLIAGFCFILTIALQIVTSGLRPYHLSSSLTKQDKTVVIGNLGKMKVDGSTFKFIVDLEAATKVCNITPGTPFLGLYNIPGVALPFQAIPVMTPWLNNRDQAEFVLERDHSGSLHSAVLAIKIEANGVYPLMPRQLVEFPSGYRYCGMATYPFGQQKFQIWQPRYLKLS